MKARKAKRSAEEIAEAKGALKKHDTDVGSAAVQVAELTARILHLTSHMNAHSNDKHSRRGLIGLVSKRRKLLKYLARSNSRKHAETLAALGLRK